MRSAALREAYYKKNPLSTGEFIGIAVVGAAILGAGGYLIYQNMNPATPALTAANGVAIVSWYPYTGPTPTVGQTIQVHGTGSDGVSYAVNLTVSSVSTPLIGTNVISAVVQGLPPNVNQPAVGTNVTVNMG